MTDPSVSEPARDAIQAMASGDDVPDNTTLAGLSGFNHAELALFKKAWDALDDERRLQIVTRLIELTENNVEYTFDGIFRICLKDSNEDIRYMAIEGLWENEETSLIDPLIELLEEDTSDKVQSAAAIALGKFAVMAEFEKLRPESIDKVREALLGAVDDRNKSAEVTRRVLESAAHLSIPDVREAINEAYESSDPELKTGALYAMGKSCDSYWLPILLTELDNEEPEIRYEAAGACGELEEEEAVPALISLIDDEDMEVRMAAIQALGKIGTPDAKECILNCLESDNDAVREAAKDAIEEINASDDPMSFRM